MEDTMFPVRLIFITLNLWLNERWDVRAPAVRQLLELYAPDVFCVQELRPETRAFIDGVLPSHARVDDPFPGWQNEGNLWWNTALLEKEEYGAEEVGLLEPERRLFWARLALRGTAAGGEARTILVSTAHLTPPVHPIEAETGQSPRVGQLKRIGAQLTRLGREGEPVFFMGDMNDARHPQRILKQAGFVSAFAALGLQSPPTFKCYPTTGVKPGETSIAEAIDIIVANRHARARSAAVLQCFCGDIAPSDHWPVQAIYEV
jgi:endonuclease/exonuclease/phosphatase family metal-dependent hydrolase